MMWLKRASLLLNSLELLKKDGEQEMHSEQPFLFLFFLPSRLDNTTWTKKLLHTVHQPVCVEFIQSCLDNDFTVTLILYLNLLTNFEAKYGVYLETQELLGTQFLVIMAYFAVILTNIVSEFKKLIQNSYDFLINCRIDSNLVQVYNASEQQQQQHKRLKNKVGHISEREVISHAWRVPMYLLIIPYTICL